MRVVPNQMILTCPECATRYEVPDTAIGPNGRTVRCASCSHSWFEPVRDQTADKSYDLLEAGSAPVTLPPKKDTPIPAAAAAPVRHPLPQNDTPQSEAPAFDAYAHQPPFSARRNPARRWTIAAAAAGLLMVAGFGAVQFLGTPGIAGWLGVKSTPVEIPLLIEVPRKPERRLQPSGNELFAVSGRIINPTDESQLVPDILAELRDSSGRVVYGWRIVPSVRKLAPKETSAFDSAEMDVPKSAKELNLSFSGASLK